MTTTDSAHSIPLSPPETAVAQPCPERVLTGREVFARLQPSRMLRGRTLWTLVLVGLVSVLLGLIELWRLWELSRLVELFAIGAPLDRVQPQLALILGLLLLLQPAVFTLLTWLRCVSLDARAAARLRGHFWAQALRLPFATAHRIGAGKLTSHGWTYPMSVLQIGGSFLSDICYFVAFACYLCVLIASQSSALLVPIALWGGLVLALAVVAAPPLQRLAHELQQATAAMNGKAVDFLNNYALLRLTPWESMPQRELQEHNRSFERRATALAQLETVMTSGANAINALCIGLGIWLLARDETLAEPEKLSLLMFFVPVMLQLNALAGIALGSVSGALGAFGTLGAVRADMTDDICPPATLPPASAIGEIVAQNITLRPEFAAPPVLRCASFRVARGDMVGLVGPSGAGKSTLLLAIAGLLPVDQGTLEVGAASGKLAICTQVPQLLAMSLRANLAFGSGCFDTERMRVVLQMVELEGLLDPDGTADRRDLEIGAFGEGLSGGQRQRLALARALLLEPEILLLDEALAGVEVDLEQRIMARLRAFLPNTTILIASHRGSSLRAVAHVLHLREGHVVKQEVAS